MSHNRKQNDKLHFIKMKDFFTKSAIKRLWKDKPTDWKKISHIHTYINIYVYESKSQEYKRFIKEEGMLEH
jgi:hypothetical protein